MHDETYLRRPGSLTHPLKLRLAGKGKFQSKSGGREGNEEDLKDSKSSDPNYSASSPNTNNEEVRGAARVMHC